MSDMKVKTAARKVPLQLIPLQALQGVARVFGYGVKKYARGNWYGATDPNLVERYAGGALRHLMAAQHPDGTFDLSSIVALDAESGLPELDHAICGLIMLRGLLAKRGVLDADPGLGKDPPAVVDPTSVHVQLELPIAHGDKCLPEPHTHSWNVPLTVSQ